MPPRRISINPRLPWEVITEVINFVPEKHRKTLRALCLTSRAAYLAASRLLHRSFTNKSDTPERHLQRLRFLVTKAKTTRLPSLIQSYECDVAYLEDCFDDSTNEEVEELWTYIPRALALMVNLKRLRYVEWVQMPRARGLSRVAFQLEELHWEIQANEAVGFAKFLETQHYLKSLYLSTGLDVPIARTACRELVYVEGSLRLFHKILPGRSSIKQIRWINIDNGADDGVPSLKGEFNRITHLSLSPGALSNYHIEELFPSLLYLELDAYAFNSGNSFMPGLPLNRLRILVLSNSGSRLAKRCSTETAHSVFDCSQSLQELFVDWETGTYTRYKRSMGTVVSLVLKWTGNGKPRLSAFERAGPDNQLAEWHTVPDWISELEGSWSRPSLNANISLGMPGIYVDPLYFDMTTMMPMVPPQDYSFSTQFQHFSLYNYAGSTIPLMPTTTPAIPTPYYHPYFGQAHHPDWNATASNFAAQITQTPSTPTQAAVPPPAQQQPSRPRRAAFVNALETIQTTMARPACDDSPTLESAILPCRRRM